MWMDRPNHYGREVNIGRGVIGIYSQEDTQTGKNTQTGKISISEPLPLDLRQTNNVTELSGGGTGSEKGTVGQTGHLVGLELSDLGGKGTGPLMARNVVDRRGGGGDDQQYRNLGRTVIGNGMTRQHAEVDLCAGARGVRGK